MSFSATYHSRFETPVACYHHYSTPPFMPQLDFLCVCGTASLAFCLLHVSIVHLWRRDTPACASGARHRIIICQDSTICLRSGRTGVTAGLTCFYTIPNLINTQKHNLHYFPLSCPQSRASSLKRGWFSVISDPSYGTAVAFGSLVCSVASVSLARVIPPVPLFRSYTCKAFLFFVCLFFCGINPR